jgi:hypothetical protein
VKNIIIVCVIALLALACTEESDSKACRATCGIVEQCEIEDWTCDPTCDDAALESDGAVVVCAATYGAEPMPILCDYLIGCIRDLREVSPTPTGR